MKRVYRLLLRLYPARFREEYAAPMERQFRDEYREAQGRGDRARLGLRALADLAVTAPAEIARELLQDLRYAARVYRQRSLVTALALAALALAIGTTTGIFSVLNALLIRSLPFQEPERLVELWLPSISVAHGRATFHAWRDGSPYLDDVTGYATNEMNLSVARESARVRVAETTANFLRMLGTEPEFGRGFAAGEDIPGRNGVAVIGYGLWQQFFGGDPRTLGSTIRLNGVLLTVVGVAPRGLDYPEKAAVWTPTVYDLERIPKSGAFGWQTIGRLKPGVSLAQASGMFKAEAERANAGRSRPRIDGYLNDPHVSSLRDRLADALARPRFYTTAILFFTGFALVLAVIGTYGAATYSVAQRTHEIGVRMAVGASPRRLRGMVFRQSMLPVSAGMLAGVLGAAGLGRFLQHLIAGAEPTGLRICLTAAFVLATATAAAVWTATGRIVRMDPTAALKVG